MPGDTKGPRWSRVRGTTVGVVRGPLGAVGVQEGVAKVPVDPVQSRRRGYRQFPHGVTGGVADGKTGRAGTRAESVGDQRSVHRVVTHE